MAPVTVTLGAYRAIIVGTNVQWFRQVIARGGKRIIWQKTRTGRWDARHGFYAGYACPTSDLDAMEQAARAAIDAAIGGR